MSATKNIAASAQPQSAGGEINQENGPPGSGGWKAHAENMERERDHWRQRAQTMFEHQRGEVWYWQGDGNDHPESMVNSLPVVIRADQLRALIAGGGQALSAARTPADSVTAAAAGAVAGPSDDDILNRTGTGYAPGTREYDLDLIRWYRERIATPPAQAADGVLEDAARALIEAIEYTPLGLRAIKAMNRLRAALAPPAEQQAQPGAVYAELPEPTTHQIAELKACEHGDAIVGWRVEPSRQSFHASMHPKRTLYTTEQARDFADRTHALRMEQAAPKAAPWEWTEQDALGILNQLSDGPFGQGEVDDALDFMRLVDAARRDKAAPDHPPMPENWGVVVSVNGENILCIGQDYLHGKRELSEAEELAIVGMAQHLLAFVGYGLPPSIFDPDDDAAPQPAPAPAPLSDDVSQKTRALIDELEKLRSANRDEEDWGTLNKRDNELRAALAAQGGE